MVENSANAQETIPLSGDNEVALLNEVGRHGWQFAALIDRRAEYTRYLLQFCMF